MLSFKTWELFKNTYFVQDLQMDGSETPVRGFLLNKVASIMSWRDLTVIERDCRTDISLWILWNFWESFFVELLLATTSYMMLFFFPIFQISEVCSLKSIYWWSNGKLGEEIHKPYQFCAVKESWWKLHCWVVATRVLT